MEALVFDIETIPDLELVRQIYDWPGLDDSETFSAVTSKFQVEKGSAFLPLHLHKVVAISLVMRRDASVKVWSLGSLDADEKDIIHRFFSGVERYCPTLVSWNGTGFDLPVLHYRSMKHGIVAAQYWDMGESRQDFRYNNYVNRYHQRHLDVMDVVSMYQGRATAKLDQIAVMLGYPGKMGMAGDKVYEAYAAGSIKAIRDYCETDVLNTYLVFLRFQLMRGRISSEQVVQEEQLLQEMLSHESQSDANEHLGIFLDTWLAQSPG